MFSYHGWTLTCVHHLVIMHNTALNLHSVAREFQKHIYFCFIEYAKVFDCVDHNKLGEIMKEMKRPEHLTYLLRNLMCCQGVTVGSGYEQWTDSKLGNVYKTVYCHPLYLPYMCRTS